MEVLAASRLNIDTTPLDWALIALYLGAVLWIGFQGRRRVSSGLDFFLSGRSLPAWITGLAFISANLGAIEILGMAANGAQYGVSTVHFYWIGAVPAMIFLGIIMMPFYYGAKVRSVPEYLRLRFDNAAHLYQSIAFSVSTVLQAGVNLFAMSIVLRAMLNMPLWVAVVLAAGIVLTYITLGGLSAAIYNEVLQFFVILAALIPITVIGLIDVGGWNGLKARVAESGTLGALHLQAWEGTGVGNVTNPIGASWIPIVFGLGFVLSFGYWTTNFAEVQRALSARNLHAARMTPIIGAFPKIFIPLVTIIPGLIAAVTISGLGAPGGDFTYNNAIPWLINNYLPTGILGVAIVGLLAAFMAGVAANVTSFNTVATYDIWEAYIRRDRPDAYYLRLGRLLTVAGIVIAIGTAFVASAFSNLMNYIQLLFSFFNAPVFATFILAMFFKRITARSGVWGLAAGTAGAGITYLLYKSNVIPFESDLAESFWGAIVAFVADVVVTIGVSMFTRPKPVEQLRGLVWGMAIIDDEDREYRPGWQSPVLWGLLALALSAAGYIVLLFVT
jgi:SSS family solute:Na+ symporter